MLWLTIPFTTQLVTLTFPELAIYILCMYAAAHTAGVSTFCGFIQNMFNNIIIQFILWAIIIIIMNC